ncbi:MAG TPA: class II aldolase/adducin family protein [Candidatus Acidoferrum sp.]|nr:class II aldolase/adducin family protein [Candidatus Acidoferrum sp.]
MKERIDELLKLSREIGRAEHRMAILGEGNTSAKLGADEFAVKASGSNLGTLTETDVTVCRTHPLLALFNKKSMPDLDMEMALLDSRVNKQAKKPSIEALFHAWLLSLEGVNFIGHSHPVTCNQILCSPRALDFVEHRMFPDEVVCCGPKSVFVPYVDPGLPLAREIRDRTLAYIKEEQSPPRLILLQNHGVIALGASPAAVLACLLMAEKAGAIFIGAASMGGPHFLAAASVERIAGRPDEHYRQRQLKMT